MAAALNCVVSGGGATCDGITVGPTFTTCNLVCEGRSDALTVQQCIDAIDAFNNGISSPGCHDRTLCNPQVPGLDAICADTPPFSAGSSDECTAASKNNCTVIETAGAKRSPANEQLCGSGTRADNEACVACAHGLCTTDGALDPVCDACVQAVCNTTTHCIGGSNSGAECADASECPGATGGCSTDPFCCDTSWDATCAQAAEGLCGAVCP
jgi:hypothetical protein